MPAVDRLYYMDNLRALAMFAGVLFHAALAYSLLAHPFVPTAHRAQSMALDTVIWFLHLFRMPLFFVVAGFFAAMLVARRGLAGLFRNRLRRIALPFMVFWPLVHTALSWSTLHAAATVKNPSPLLVLIQDFSQKEGLPAQMPGTAHLWFLYYLMFFYLLIWSAQNFELEKLEIICASSAAPGSWAIALAAGALAAVSAPNPAPKVRSHNSGPSAITAPSSPPDICSWTRVFDRAIVPGRAMAADGQSVVLWVILVSAESTHAQRRGPFGVYINRSAGGLYQRLDQPAVVLPLDVCA